MANSDPRRCNVSRIPSFKQGDRLSREEFERRYGRAMAQRQEGRTSLEEVRGNLVLPGRFPVPRQAFIVLRGDFIWWPQQYCGSFTTRRSRRGNANSVPPWLWTTEPQPDGLLIREQVKCGQVMIWPDGYIEGAPKLGWVEIGGQYRQLGHGPPSSHSTAVIGSRSNIVWPRRRMAAVGGLASCLGGKEDFIDVLP